MTDPCPHIVYHIEGLLYIDKDIMKIKTSMLRPKLKYAVVVWFPHKEKNTRKLERLQRVTTKVVPKLQDFD